SRSGSSLRATRVDPSGSAPERWPEPRAPEAVLSFERPRSANQMHDRARRTRRDPHPLEGLLHAALLGRPLQLALEPHLDASVGRIGDTNGDSIACDASEDVLAPPVETGPDVGFDAFAGFGLHCRFSAGARELSFVDAERFERAGR